MEEDGGEHKGEVDRRARGGRDGSVLDNAGGDEAYFRSI